MTEETTYTVKFPGAGETRYEERVMFGHTFVDGVATGVPAGSALDSFKDAGYTVVEEDGAEAEAEAKAAAEQAEAEAAEAAEAVANAHIGKATEGTSAPEETGEAGQDEAGAPEDDESQPSEDAPEGEGAPETPED